jgi:hypothetical protein
MAFRWLNKAESGVKRAGQALGVAHGAYQVGRQLWAGAQAIAPYAAMLL